MRNESAFSESILITNAESLGNGRFCANTSFVVYPTKHSIAKMNIFQSFGRYLRQLVISFHLLINDYLRLMLQIYNSMLQFYN
ncbi:MAG TPA: hypothetical protein DCM62_03455 [Bacteroidales bacterium]|nr:hypothetical protein [Bacteroidales bacterium]